MRALDDVLLDIDYDAANPRIARLRAGTRHFPHYAEHQVLLIYGPLAALIIAVAFGARALRTRGSRVRA